jgi:hypothetical protein
MPSEMSDGYILLEARIIICNRSAILVIFSMAVENQNMLYFSHAIAARGLASVG